MAHDTAILDFGTSKITVLVGERGVNGTIVVKGMGVCDYAGFTDGEWLDPEHMAHAVGRAVSSAEANSGEKNRASLRRRSRRIYFGHMQRGRHSPQQKAARCATTMCLI